MATGRIRTFTTDKHSKRNTFEEERIRRARHSGTFEGEHILKRVLIIGSGGAGKSTLAREMGDVTGIPVYHLDAAYWNPGWVATSDEDWDDTVRGLISAEEWIIDGNYSRTLDIRAARADTIIFLDMPRWITVYRIVKRRIRYHGQTRPDLREGCPEKLDWEFVRWVWSYRDRRRPGIMDKLTALSKQKRIIILRSPREVRQFMMAMAHSHHFTE